MDDDNYVNPKGLLQLLSTFSPSQDIYLGRPSLDHPIEAREDQEKWNRACWGRSGRGS